MRFYTLAVLLLATLTFSGCYLTEDAADVNQERISTTYCTVFNASRDYTKSIISFKFGNTPLRLSNAMYFRNMRLFENEDFIWGLHYSRDVDGISDGTYEWTDENGEIYFNEVKAFSFNLTNPITEIEKYKYYNLEWTGDLIPFVAGDFYITIDSHVDGTKCTFYAGEQLEIESDKLDYLPIGPARMIISRNYSEPIDEGTQA